MKRLFQHNKVFLIPFIIIWVFLGIVLIAIHKSTIHLILNQYHSPFFDSFFKNITHLGDGLTPAFIAVVMLLFFSFRKAFIVGIGASVAGLLAQFFKRVVFPDYLRPKAYFNNIIELYLVPNVEVHDFFSFPSGHATTSFFLFFALAWMTNNKGWKVFWLFMAFITGYSRIYLSQHFLVDVYFGALLGITMATASILIFNNFKAGWLDKSVLKMVKK